METVQSKLDFKIAKTGHLVPVIDGVHLHSIYDPIKEAEFFVQDHDQEIKKSNNLIVLGLGFGYHIFSLVEKIKSYHGGANVVVIEPSKSIVEAFIQYCAEKCIKVEFKILSGELEALYKNDILLNFLLLRPQVIAHKTSFNKDREYYVSFLQYRASKTLSTFTLHLNRKILDLIGDDWLPSMTFEQLQKKSLNNPVWTKKDFFIQFFHHIATAKNYESEARDQKEINI